MTFTRPVKFLMPHYTILPAFLSTDAAVLRRFSSYRFSYFYALPPQSLPCLSLLLLSTRFIRCCSVVLSVVLSCSLRPLSGSPPDFPLFLFAPSLPFSGSRFFARRPPCFLPSFFSSRTRQSSPPFYFLCFFRLFPRPLPCFFPAACPPAFFSPFSALSLTCLKISVIIVAYATIFI